MLEQLHALIAECDFADRHVAVHDLGDKIRVSVHPAAPGAVFQLHSMLKDVGLPSQVSADADAVTIPPPAPLKVRVRGEMPVLGTAGAAGYDLRSTIGLTLPPGESHLVPTKTAVALPPETVALVCPRSGLAAKHGITVLNTPGVIDSDYRGDIHVHLINHGKDMFRVEPGDRIAQMVIVELAKVTMIPVAEFRDRTERGANGHGSTGVA